MRYLILLTIFIPGFLTAQTGDTQRSTGPAIQFEKNLTWSQVLSKAKEEHKPVFVDCYTTWCGPCKRMESEVYTDSAVAGYCNSHFISVKYQMDTTKNDDPSVVKSYTDAANIRIHFAIESYPTLLFFNEEGQLLNRNLGAVESVAFRRLLSDILDPKKNYYNLLAEFHAGNRDLVQMHTLALTALTIIKDTTTAGAVIKAYFATLGPDSLFTKDNITFLRQFTRSSKDMGFQLFYRQSVKINHIMEDDGYAQSVVQNVIYDEMITPQLANPNAKVDDLYWLRLKQRITEKYNLYYGNRLVWAAKVDWAASAKNWKQYNRLFTGYVNTYVYPSQTAGHWPAFTLNNFAWEIFQRSNNKTELRQALNWSRKAVLMDPTASWIDTYANLLYKIGDVKLALSWEKIAKAANPADADISTTLEKMETGKPTWPAL